MIKNHVYIPLITVLLFVTVSCESVTPEEPLPAVLKGQVVDKATSTPIQGALVQVLSPAPPQEVNTNAQGGWSIELDIDDITTVVLRVTMDGYRQENFELMAAPGREVNAPAIRIEAIPSTDPGEDPGTGQPGTTNNCQGHARLPPSRCSSCSICKRSPSGTCRVEVGRATSAPCCSMIAMIFNSTSSLIR